MQAGIEYIKKMVTYFIVLKSQNWIDDSEVAAIEFTSCGFHAPPDKECRIPAVSLDTTSAIFFEESKLHNTRFCSSMLISLSDFPEGHQRTLFPQRGKRDTFMRMWIRK